MRQSGNRNSRKSRSDSDGTSTSTYGIELDRMALSTKNGELTKENVKLKSENADLRSEILRLQSHLFHVQRKEAELKQDIKSKAPYFAQMVTSLMQYCESDVTAANRISLPTSSKDKNSTQRVGPHMVNGIVLNVSPKVSLTRMNPVCSSECLPSTSANSIEPAQSEYSNLSNADSDSSENILEDDLFLSSYSENEDPSDSETLNCSASRRRLRTISEESEHSRIRCHNEYFLNGTEMHITLTRMSIEEMRRNTFRNRDSSMEAVGGIETTGIEDQDFEDTGGSKNTRKMTFSPYFNSRRVVDGNSALREIQPIEPPRTNHSQNSQMESIDSVRADCSSDSLVISAFACLPTPSMSALGDIDRNNSRLEILLESGITSTPAIARSYPDEQLSPLSSKGNSNSMQRSTKLVTPRSKRRRIPVVVLEKMRDSSIQLQSGDNKQTELSLDATSRSNSNLYPSENTTRSENKSKSTKESIKRKLTDEGDETEAVPENDGSQNGRPRRLAKPTILKEQSLKQKLRRT